MAQRNPGTEFGFVRIFDMKNNLIYMNDYREAHIEQEDQDDSVKHREDGERCICWNCEDARRFPKTPDYNSLPLFRAMNYKA